MSSLYNLHCGRRRRRRRLSLLVIIEEVPLNTQHNEEKRDEDELLFRLPLHNHTSLLVFNWHASLNPCCVTRLA
jgi:hypothetical protein